MRSLLLLLLTMHITTQASVQAWSTDGLSALISYDADGPEGGGSSGYGVLTCAGLQARVTVSSDFSPGGGSRPQRITEQACRDGLAKLGEALKANKFTGVTVTPDDCKKRLGMVAVEPAKFASGVWTIVTLGKGLVVKEGTRNVLEVPEGSNAMVSPTGRAIVVMSRAEDGSRVQGLWTRAASGPFVRCRD